MKSLNLKQLFVSLTLVFALLLSAPMVAENNEVHAATKKVKVTFKANGGTFKASKWSKKKVVKKKFKKNKKLGKLPKIKKSGKVFKGWYTKKKGGKKITKKSKLKKNTTVYARWSLSRERKLFNHINKERTKRGIAKLKWCEDLKKPAKIRAKEQMDAPGHYRPDGSLFDTVAPGLADNENIYVSWSSKHKVKNVVPTWLKSSIHKKTMLNPDYKGVAIGYYKKKIDVSRFYKDRKYQTYHNYVALFTKSE